HLLVETVFMVKSYPDEFKSATSLIYDFWKEIGDTDAIEQYEMQPFDIRVQTLERTLIDKVFALCNHALSGKIKGLSRHIYDLSKLLTKVELTDELKQFVKEIRYARKENERYLIEQGDEHIPSILRDIIDKGIYRQDYEQITRYMLYDTTPYDEAIKSLETIIASGVFE
ncbi:MAG: nucleotidyl transferase AbiEii/AbiGii toxin family protein, partial [Firmicutes bacterium]|nr:nucleotidyl transferase AbiEii/AbiGii toxin family protein [Bacillota bacterium]